MISFWESVQNFWTSLCCLLMTFKNLLGHRFLDYLTYQFVCVWWLHRASGSRLSPIDWFCPNKWPLWRAGSCGSYSALHSQMADKWVIPWTGRWWPSRPVQPDFLALHTGKKNCKNKNWQASTWKYFFAFQVRRLPGRHIIVVTCYRDLCACWCVWSDVCRGNCTVDGFSLDSV